MLDLVASKVVILTVMFLVTLCISMVPFKLIALTQHDSKWKKIVSLSACFSGGIFLGACILDLFPDVHEAVNAVVETINDEYHYDLKFPFSGFIICCGFFLVLFIEQGIIICKESEKPHPPLMVNSTISISHSVSETNPLIHNRDNHNVHEVICPAVVDVEDDSDSSGSNPAIDCNHDHNHDHHLSIFEHSTVR